MKSPTFTPSNFICWRHHHQKNPQHSPVSTRSGFSSAVSFGQDGWRRNPSRHCKRNGMQERCPARHEWNPFIFFWGGIYLVDLFPNPVAVTSHHQDYYMFGKESYWAPGGGVDPPWPSRSIPCLSSWSNKPGSLPGGTSFPGNDGTYGERVCQKDARDARDDEWKKHLSSQS